MSTEEQIVDEAIDHEEMQRIEERRRKGREAYQRNKDDPEYKKRAQLARKKYYQKNKASIIQYQLDKRHARSKGGSSDVLFRNINIQYGDFVLTPDGKLINLQEEEKKEEEN